MLRLLKTFAIHPMMSEEDLTSQTEFYDCNESSTDDSEELTEDCLSNKYENSCQNSLLKNPARSLFLHENDISIQNHK